MLVSEVMTSPARSLPLEASVDAAAELLGRARISAVPIVDEHGLVVGIVSEADVLRERLPADPRAHLRPSVQDEPATRLVSEVMTSDPTTVPTYADCADVAATFAEFGFKSLPVVDDRGHLLGVVSRSDIVRVLSAPSAVVADAIALALDRAGLASRTVQVESGHVLLAASNDGLDDAARAVVATVPGVRSVHLT
ncbi:hypothetical protein N802_14725 [Knoellia sinensis KCTC 19936]|uniref:CBS domain-containing protein n=1 Tax=Knoellia sinensis KCTC 19936 TaxID=1385520 RepID=A0A0A0J7P0_9MICO|nr:CBS domain-containing protein [Knoellia sinensis]KGN33405.1 hypothetical protein N802_14725 [Knoellia sinensis KCTC 19936]